MDADATAAPQAENTAHSELLDAAYKDYHQRLARGETVDAREYCGRFAPIRSSLAKMLHLDEYVEANFEHLVDAPSNWPQVGSEWEEFELLAELGRGSFARVYLAYELPLGGRLVAIKCTSFGAREAATLGRLHHPNVMPIHSIRDLPDHNLTIVCMPYLGHATLLHVCRHLHGQTQPIDRAATILDACRDALLPAVQAPAVLRWGSYFDGVRWLAAHIAGALAYLHAQGICHRDLKPSNILLQPDGTPRLLDFNLSADALLPQAHLGGTLQYMAPEQLQAMEHGDAAVLTPQVDIFALGVILHEWLSGSHPCAPLPANNDPAALRRHLLHRYQDQGQALPALTLVEPALARVIERCLRRHPAQRPTAAQVEQALQRQLRPERRTARSLWQHPRRTLGVLALFLGGMLAWGTYQAAAEPARAQAAYQKGWQAFRAGDFKGAVTHFDAAAAQGAAAADCHFARARAFQRLGETNKKLFFSLADEEYKKAYMCAPNGKYAAGQAYCAHRLGMLDVAEMHYQKALGQGFNTAALHHNLGCLYQDRSDLKKDDFKKAQSHFEQALALDDRASLTHCQMADLLASLYRRDEKPKEEPGVADAPMPDSLRRALAHLKSGSPAVNNAPANQAVQLAPIYALAVPFDWSQADKALTWLERAIDAGSSTSVCRNPDFEPLASNPRYAALLQRQPTAPRPIADWVRILDPLDE